MFFESRISLFFPQNFKIFKKKTVIACNFSFFILLLSTLAKLWIHRYVYRIELFCRLYHKQDHNAYPAETNKLHSFHYNLKEAPFINSVSLSFKLFFKDIPSITCFFTKKADAWSSAPINLWGFHVTESALLQNFPILNFYYLINF